MTMQWSGDDFDQPCGTCGEPYGDHITPDEDMGLVLCPLNGLADEAWTGLKAFADEYHDVRLEQALGLLAAVRNDYFATDEEVQG